ncbi:hypothetical protein G0P98_28355, partial [Yangia sp. PrR004]|nr:hypothetical protein [Salipiger sp. PrR004]
KKGSVPAKRAVSGIDKTADKKDITSHPPTISQKNTFMEVDSLVRTPVEIRESDGGSGSIINDNIMQYQDANHKPRPEVSVQ